jgi:hypothetical protein
LHRIGEDKLAQPISDIPKYRLCGIFHKMDSLGGQAATKGVAKSTNSVASVIHSLFQFFATPEKGQTLGFNGYRFPRFWISAFIGTILLYENATKTPDLNTVTVCECIGHFSKKKINHPFRFLSRKPVFPFQGFDQFTFVHIHLLCIVNYISIVKA